MEESENSLKLLSFWAINGELCGPKLRRQLDEMKSLGMQGTIFHPRYYPGRPAYMSKEYLQQLSETILYAKKLGLEFWIYDENGWPSGNADGHVLERFPKSRCEWLACHDGTVCLESRPGFNTLCREEMAYFIEFTYEGYRKGLSEEAFSYVTGFFSDEVGFLDGESVTLEKGAIPWCREAEETYESRYGRAFREDWGLLFREGEGCREVRYRYWQILSDILADSFYRPVNEWCVRYGKRYTAHLKGEENLYFQVGCSGSVYRNLMEVNVPAVDALERYPGNHYYPRIASSLSRQFSDGRCLAEAMGGSGWGMSPEDMVRYVDWLAESGIDTIVFHLWQYCTKSASVRDWPPNIPRGLTWRTAAKEVFARLRKKWDGKIRQNRPVLLIAPERGVMAGFDPGCAPEINVHNGSGYADCEGGRISAAFGAFVEHCHGQGLAFDVCSERIFEEYGCVEDGQLRIGNAVYSAVICGEGALFTKASVREQAVVSGIWYEEAQWKWRYMGHGGNQFLLEGKENCISYREDADRNEAGRGEDWRVRVQDPVREVYVQETLLTVEERDGLFYCEMPDDIMLSCREKGEIRIRLVPLPDGEQDPFAWLEGDFAVKSRAGYTQKNGHQWRTEGDFYLTQLDGEKIKLQDLTESGFPFCGSYVEAQSMAYVGEDGVLTFDASGLHADCIAAALDGEEEYGRYCWGPEWRLEGIAPGIHTVRIRLIPSTFNTFGPHHHRDGDRHLTSPMQYSGEKGFADTPDAPSFTLVKEYHVVKFGI